MESNYYSIISTREENYMLELFKKNNIEVESYNKIYTGDMIYYAKGDITNINNIRNEDGIVEIKTEFGSSVLTIEEFNQLDYISK